MNEAEATVASPTKSLEEDRPEEWTQEVVCGNCESQLSVRAHHLRLLKKKDWGAQYLGFRCGACRRPILFAGPPDRRGWHPANCDYPPEPITRVPLKVEEF